MPQLESSLGGKKKEQEDKSPRIKSGSSLQLERNPMQLLESSLLQIAASQVPACTSPVERICHTAAQEESPTEI